MSPGNAINVALQITLSHWRRFARLILVAYLWFLPGLGVILAGIGAALMGMAGVGIGLILLGGLGLVVGIAEFFFCSAVISRFAAQELLGQAESLSQTQQALQPLKWRFFNLAMLIGLLLMLIYMAFTPVVAFFVGFGIVGVGYQADSMGLYAVLLGVGVILFFIGLEVLFYLYCRWLVGEVALGMEDGLTANRAMYRVWGLSQGSAGFIQLVALIGFLVTLPVITVVSYVPQGFLLGIDQESPLYWLIYGLSFLATLAVNVFLAPFWQVIKAVVYVDLRQRKEGLGLRLPSA